MQAQLSMNVLGCALKRDVQQVVALWSLAAAEEPWVLLPDHDRVDFLPHVIETLAEVMLCRQPDDAGMRLVIDAAIEHGVHRAALGIPDSVIFVEYDLLRRAIWRYFRSGDEDGTGPDRRIARAMLRLDSGISLCTRASLVGYHRPQITQLGRWPEILSQLMRETALHWDVGDPGDDDEQP